MKINKVAVIGSGIMGNQIAMQTAISGYEVWCYDISREALDKAKAFADDWFTKRVLKGKMGETDAEKAKSLLHYSDDLAESGKDTDLVIEAVSDKVAVKKSALAAIDEVTPEHTIFASNSSYIVSSRFADAVKDPSKVLNMHFFNPALVMKIVEVVKGPHVSEETFNTAFEFVESIGKTPIKIEKEIYGFVVNRIFSALTREACYLLDNEVASVEDIDKAVKGALGHTMGPLETLDMTGIDLEYSVYMEKFHTSGKKEDLPAACLTERYARGEYGRKTGKGFYDYEK